DIDSQRFWRGAGIPQYRFYSQADPFGQLVPPIYGNNRGISLDVGGNLWYNIDPPPTGSDGFNTFPYQGNLRFRHGRNTTCNVGYADGHVAQLTGKFNAAGRPLSHDAIRKYFMVRWPSGGGIGANPNFPGG